MEHWKNFVTRKLHRQRLIFIRDPPLIASAFLQLCRNIFININRLRWFYSYLVDVTARATETEFKFIWQHFRPARFIIAYVRVSHSIDIARPRYKCY